MITCEVSLLLFVRGVKGSSRKHLHYCPSPVSQFIYSKLFLLVIIYHRPPAPKDLRRARKRRLLEIRTKSYITEMVMYFIFVAMLSFVVHTYREPNEYRLSEALKYVTSGEYFSEVSSPILSFYSVMTSNCTQEAIGFLLPRCFLVP